ncbi:diaminopimelate epimerase, partial [Opitutaceae bacterium]|nr:diaminopimelate epimerase [Opitutaceae bacterium]
NDYLVLDPEDFPQWDEPNPDHIRVICHRNFGLGSDGILWGPIPSHSSEFGLRIFNPDGSEAEKSGNGLRIFSRYLRDSKKTSAPSFTIETLGGNVKSDIHADSNLITVDMGKVSFHSGSIPVTGESREVISEQIQVAERQFEFCAATIGNPHCVVPLAKIDAQMAHEFGPQLETHSIFPQRTNVQFLQVLDRRNIRIEIWERGAGYTLASGSSSSAAAAVAHRLGKVDSELTVHMPGGEIQIAIDPSDYAIRMIGSVNRVATGTMHPELFDVKV